MIVWSRGSQIANYWSGFSFLLFDIFRYNAMTLKADDEELVGALLVQLYVVIFGFVFVLPYVFFSICLFRPICQSILVLANSCPLVNCCICFVIRLICISNISCWHLAISGGVLNPWWTLSRWSSSRWSESWWS